MLKAGIFDFDPATFINEKLDGIWQHILYYVSFQFVDPFYRWLTLGILIIIGLGFLAKFFGDWIPQLKPIIGGLIIMIGTSLAAYRFGEKGARDHDALAAKMKGKKKGTP